MHSMRVGRGEIVWNMVLAAPPAGFARRLHRTVAHARGSDLGAEFARFPSLCGPALFPFSISTPDNPARLVHGLPVCSQVRFALPFL